MEEAIGIEVDSSQLVLYQLAEVVQNFNEDLDGKNKLLQKEKKKFENKMLEHISQQIAIYQVE